MRPYPVYLGSSNLSNSLVSLNKTTRTASVSQTEARRADHREFAQLYTRYTRTRYEILATLKQTKRKPDRDLLPDEPRY